MRTDPRAELACPVCARGVLERFLRIDDVPVVTTELWHRAIAILAESRCSLIALWAEPATVHMALREGHDVAVLSLSCPDGGFPSVGASHAPAIRLERAIHDLYGLVPAA